MYKKVLVPLDTSTEAEGVLPLVQGRLAPEGEVVLLHVIPPGKTSMVGAIMLYAEQEEEARREKAMTYLRGLVSRMGADPDKWHCDVAVSQSVAEGIATYAAGADADHIMMFTHDRKGLVKLIRGSIAEKVMRSAPVEVEVIRPRELMPS